MIVSSQEQSADAVWRDCPVQGHRGFTSLPQSLLGGDSHSGGYPVAFSFLIFCF